MCYWSGSLGPKLKEGDGQSPEGFFTVAAKQLIPEAVDLDPSPQVASKERAATPVVRPRRPRAKRWNSRERNQLRHQSNFSAPGIIPEAVDLDPSPQVASQERAATPVVRPRRPRAKRWNSRERNQLRHQSNFSAPGITP